MKKQANRKLRNLHSFEQMSNETLEAKARSITLRKTHYKYEIQGGAARALFSNEAYNNEITKKYKRSNASSSTQHFVCGKDA